jgi:hypothetical protein
MPPVTRAPVLARLSATLPFGRCFNTMPRVLNWRILPAFAALIAGCTLPPTTRDLNDAEPTAKIPAIKMAALKKDDAHISQLVEDLDSDDPAIRLFAIRALKDLTGETFDYQYFDDDLERQPALRSWHQWLKARNAPPSSQEAAPATTNAATSD